LAQDAENDVYFNVMSLAFPVSDQATFWERGANIAQFAGSKLHWRLLDPIGGMVLSLYIIYEWVKTLLENFAHRQLPISLLRVKLIDHQCPANQRQGIKSPGCCTS
jgi:hypothetical protein